MHLSFHLRKKAYTLLHLYFARHLYSVLPSALNSAVIYIYLKIYTLIQIYLTVHFLLYDSVTDLQSEITQKLLQGNRPMSNTIGWILFKAAKKTSEHRKKKITHMHLKCIKEGRVNHSSLYKSQLMLACKIFNILTSQNGTIFFFQAVVTQNNIYNNLKVSLQQNFSSVSLSYQLTFFDLL